MKTILTFSALLLFLFLSFTSSAQVYVDHAATGTNTGTSWTDAFPTLSEALNSTPIPDTIKVAMGTYTPDVINGSPASTFLIDTDLILLGGYNALTGERNPDWYETILSGDLNDDDEEDDFDYNKSDNVMTVVTVTTNVSNASLIDGFTIRNGHADGAGSTANITNSGGALYATSAPRIQQCTFTQNFSAYRGGAIYVYYNGSDLLEFNSCHFTENQSSRGGALTIRQANTKLLDCFITSNFTPEQGGGLWYISTGSNQTLELDNCTFEDNASSFGGGMYFGAWNSSNSSNLIMNNCLFTKNASENFMPGWGNNGAACYQYIGENTSNINTGISDCQFTLNTGDHVGALAITLGGNSILFDIRRSSFMSNTSAGLDLWGTNGGTGLATVDSCHFEGNTAIYDGGMSVGNGWNGGASVNYHISNSNFINNEAMEGGGLGFWCSENSNTNITLENCLIQGNRATVRGGGISLWPLSNNLNVNVSQCQIIENESPLGGAIDGFIFDSTVDLPDDISIQFDNCLIADNLSQHAAISLDSITNFSLINCTVAGNSGGGIKLDDQSSVILQNTILYNNGDTEIEDVTADGFITSNGGNLIGDNSLGTNAHASDQEGDPLFNESGDNCTKYQLSSEDSPAVGHGIPGAGQSEFDVCGNSRNQGGQIDIGSFESDFLGVDVNEIFITELSVFPNPASDYISIQFPKSMTSAFQTQIFDSRGRLIKSASISDNQNIQVKDLVAGLYTIKVKDNKQVYIGRFFKH